MSLTAVLEIVLSLAALFWLMAMVASFLLEAVNSLVLRLRAAALQRFVAEMVLGSGRVRNAYGHMRLKLHRAPSADPLGVLSHALVLSLHKPDTMPGREDTPPSYIPAPVFARALLDRVAALAEGAVFGGPAARSLAAVLGAVPGLPAPLQQRLAVTHWPADAAAHPFTLVAALYDGLGASTSPQVRAALQAMDAALAAALAPGGPAPAAHPDFTRWLHRLLQATQRAVTALDQEPGADPTRPLAERLEPGALWALAMREAGAVLPPGMNPLDAVRAVVEHAPLPHALRQSLRPLLSDANYSFEALRSGVEGWYDGVMERASGWFKRNTTLALGGIGFVMAMVGNVNPIWIARDLAADPTLRAAGVAFAEQAVRSGGDATLVQQAAFAQAARARRWVERTDGLRADDPTVSNRLRVLALEMQPLLLRHGGLVGLLPEVGTPHEDGTWPADMTAEAFVDSVCRAVKSTPATLADAAPSASAPPDARCAAVDAVFASAKATRAEAAGAFWSSPLLVWQPALGQALYGALAAPRADRAAAATAPSGATSAPPGAAPAEAGRAQAIAALRTTLRVALQEADIGSAAARDYLDRIPSLGWPQPTPPGLSPHEAAQHRGLLVLAALLGWPLTALMVSFGAPFWFDLMSKLIQRRVTGPKPVPEPR